MAKLSRIYCFRADYGRSPNLHQADFPDWLKVATNWQGYRISTLPWIADVAQVLGILQVENTASGWQIYLENLGFQGVILIPCEDLFEDTLYS
ncbi:MAG: hypothetical protein HC835_18580 [Oscillatoriales cyanobacterium RM2_1_1]|nr:hypothetical protein [Oscillatoriales cyanobacterium SM2_3_0]NJO47450.1 hypothetical protein [Oscillatoriales cyanobacterium RM2_1_1]